MTTYFKCFKDMSRVPTFSFSRMTVNQPFFVKLTAESRAFDPVLQALFFNPVCNDELVRAHRELFHDALHLSVTDISS